MQQQQTTNTVCPECLHKDSIIHRYCDLVRLMKKKQMRCSQNRSKDSLGSILSTQTNALGCAVRGDKMIGVVQKIEERRMQVAFRKILLRSVSRIGPFIEPLAAENQKQMLRNVKKEETEAKDAQERQKIERKTLEARLVSSISEYPSQFLEELFKFKNTKLSDKKIFELTLKNSQLTEKVKKLELTLDQNQRRQDKQLSKKRMSLEGLVQQLAEKNEIMEEMKQTIKSLELRLASIGDNMVLRMLEEDGDSLKRIIAKLEGVNDKLNHDVAKLKQEKKQFEQKLQKELQVNENLRKEVFSMKEELFTLHNEKQQNELLKRELDLVSTKMNNKMEKIKKAEKKINEFSKLKDSLSTNSMTQSEKKVQIQSTTLNLLYKSSQFDTMNNKLQNIFTFLFHIEEEGYQLHEPELYDDEEKELLMTHKERFIKNFKLTREDVIRPVSTKTIDIHNKSLISFGESFLDAFNEQTPNVAPISNLKLLELQNENFKLIEKISELKQKHLHIRCVILQFLKSLDLKNFKKDSQSILTILCEYFEYSEEQRNVILQSKNRKYFGFI